MSKTNLCLLFTAFFISAFFFELLLIGLHYPMPSYLLPIITLGAILFFPLPAGCICSIILITGASNFIHNISVQTTIIFLSVLWLSSDFIRTLLLPRIPVFGSALLLLSVFWIFITTPPSTIRDYSGILILVLLVALLWDMVRKTIAKDTF